MGGHSDSDDSGSSTSGSPSPPASPREASSSSKREKKEAKKKDRKKEKKHKKEKKRKRERDGSDDERDKKRKKDKKKDKKRDKDEGGSKDPPRRAVPVQLDAQEDYYSRATEFRVWLKLVKNKSFEDLSREDAQDLFESFVSAWNKGKLADMFYDGIPVHIRNECTRTTHKWGFLKKMGETEKFQLDTMADRVGAANYSAPKPTIPDNGPRGARGGGMPPPSSRSAGDQQLKREQEREERRAKERAMRDKHRVVMDEMAPKATGREAMIQARQAKGDRLHGASRAKDDARDGLDMGESQIMGGDDNMQARLARSKDAQRRRQDDRDRRVLEAQQKEQEAMAKLMKDLGLKPGQKITIPSRQP